MFDWKICFDPEQFFSVCRRLYFNNSSLLFANCRVQSALLDVRLVLVVVFVRAIRNGERSWVELVCECEALWRSFKLLLSSQSRKHGDLILSLYIYKLASWRILYLFYNIRNIVCYGLELRRLVLVRRLNSLREIWTYANLAAGPRYEAANGIRLFYFWILELKLSSYRKSRCFLTPAKRRHRGKVSDS